MLNQPASHPSGAHGMAGTAATIFSPDALEKLLRFAEVMAKGRVAVPAHLAGNAADCLSITMQAAQWGMNPFAVAQKTHFINGTLGYEAQLVNAVVTSMAPTRDRLHYEWFGPWENVIGKFIEKTSPKGNKYAAPDWTLKDESGCGVRVWATMNNEAEPRVLELLLSQAQVRNSTLWASDPKQQLAYLAVKRWARLHCPDVILGVYTPDELETGRPAERDITPAAADDINALINQSARVTPSHSSPKTKSMPDVADDNKSQPADTPSEGLTSTDNEVSGKKSATESVTAGKTEKRLRSPDELLTDFAEAAMNKISVDELQHCFNFASKMLRKHPALLEKATDVYLIRKAELEEAASGSAS